MTLRPEVVFSGETRAPILGCSSLDPRDVREPGARGGPPTNLERRVYRRADARRGDESDRRNRAIEKLFGIRRLETPPRPPFSRRTSHPCARLPAEGADPRSEF